MVHKKEEGTYHHIETLMKEMPGFLSPGIGLPLLLIPEYSGLNKEQRIPERSKTAHRKPPVKCFLTVGQPGQPTTAAAQGPGLEQRLLRWDGILLLLSPLRFVGQKLEESGTCPQPGPTSGHLPPASPCQPETFHVPYPGLHACPYHMRVSEFPGCHTL